MFAALNWFERAVALDPDFARAHVQIAWTYAELLTRGSVSPEIAEAPARAAIARALTLDPSSSDAYTARGKLKFALGELTDSGADFLRAIELNPNNAWPYQEYGHLLFTSLSRPVEAVAYLEKALALEPNWGFARSILGLALAEAPGGSTRGWLPPSCPAQTPHTPHASSPRPRPDDETSCIS